MKKIEWKKIDAIVSSTFDKKVTVKRSPHESFTSTYRQEVLSLLEELELAYDGSEEWARLARKILRKLAPDIRRGL